VSENLQKFLNRKGRESVPELKKGTSIGRSPDYPGAVAGEYFGYLHHENSGRYQLVRLKIEADYDRESSMKKQGLVVNAVATAFYGDQSSPEFAVYKFGPSYFSESSPQFIFNGPGESIIQVSSWYEHGLKALWYGKSHGRLGTIELLRDKIPHLRSQSKLMSRFSGSYVGTQTNIDLYSQADISLSHNDFFPLPTKGVMTGRNQSGKKSMIQALSFDPYSDRLAFDMLDGRMLIGVRSKGGFVLNWSEANQYGSAVNTTTEETYTQTSASIPTKTATNNEGRP
jgi:hypothetical protein